MSNKTNKIIYYIGTVILSLMMTGSGIMYIVNHATIAESFTALGFPTYLVYPLAIAKLLGVVALWLIKSKTLKEWAYAGFFFNLILAVSAHINAGDGDFAPATMGLVFWLISYVFYKRLNK